MRTGGRSSMVDLVRQGAVVDVTLTPEAEAISRRVRPVPRLRERLLVDTGAHFTVVDRRIAEQLDVEPVDSILMVGVSMEPEERPVYIVNIALRVTANDGTNGTISLKTPIVGMGKVFSPLHPYAGLLGRDFLRLVNFTYDGPRGGFELELDHASILGGGD